MLVTKPTVSTQAPQGGLRMQLAYEQGQPKVGSEAKFHEKAAVADE